jgi:hypothetical protein
VTEVRALHSESFGQSKVILVNSEEKSILNLGEKF